MEFSFSAADETFRQEIRGFFTDIYPQDIIAKLASGASLTTTDIKRSEGALSAQGYLAVNWPQEYGGTGWTAEQKYIFDDELEKAGALQISPFGIIYVGPVIYTFGTEDQKKRWLPGILDGSVQWAQGYSEPNSGSDLASLQCKAERVGDHYLLNGTKTWTSSAQHADWLFCLVRTDNSGRKQEGISFLCMDINTPGISIQPIITLDGKRHVSQVDLIDVLVSVENLVGEEGKGWTYANYLLGHERTSYVHISEKRKILEHVWSNAGNVRTSDGSLQNDPAFVTHYTGLQQRLDGLEMTTLRTLASVAGGGAPGNESSILKIAATELAQDISYLGMMVNGPYACLKFPDNVTPEAFHNAVPTDAARQTGAYLMTRAQTIYGGATEVQKNIIAKRILGL